MPSEIELKVDISEVEDAIRGLRMRPNNLSMKPVAAMLVTAVDDVIQAQGAVPGSQRWDPLKQSTIDRHPRRAGGMLLQDTGLLANVQSRHNSANHQASVESPAPYAHFHLTGARNMPKRDFLAVDQDALLRETEDYVLQELTRWTRR